MATTTNYGWSTPDDTALVKNGASAIRSLGTAIDTTTYNNAQAAIAKAIVDAKGDIIAATAADTVARLAVGANDTVLTADSSTATGLKWAVPATSSFVGCLTAVSGTQTISNATQTKCEFAGTDVYDTDAFHDPSSNNSRITIPTGKGGYYLIYGAWQWDNNATGRRIIYITKNNNIMYSTAGFSPANGPQYPNNFISVVLNLAVADYVELEVYQNSGGNLNRDAQTYFGVVKLG